MRILTWSLGALLLMGCAKGPSNGQAPAPASQFAEVNLTFGPPQDPSRPQDRPGRLSCTVGLIPAYRHKDPPQLALWVFPRSSAAGLNADADLSAPALHGHQAQIVEQAFSGEGVLLHFDAVWPGGPQDQILALDVVRGGRRFVRVFATMQQ